MGGGKAGRARAVQLLMAAAFAALAVLATAEVRAGGYAPLQATDPAAAARSWAATADWRAWGPDGRESDMSALPPEAEYAALVPGGGPWRRIDADSAGVPPCALAGPPLSPLCYAQVEVMWAILATHRPNDPVGQQLRQAAMRMGGGGGSVDPASASCTAPTGPGRRTVLGQVGRLDPKRKHA